MDRFLIVSEFVHAEFDARNQARDKALVQARQVIRFAATAIRAIHRMDIEEAKQKISAAKHLVQQLRTDLADYPELFYAGYTQDAFKEYVEAEITTALILNQELPLPSELNVEPAAYLNGLAEVGGELRRRCLDILRKGYSDEAERLLGLMDEIYALLITVDYPDALTYGLRRKTDLARGIVERTRGDMTISLREQRLTQAMKELSLKLDVEFNNEADTNLGEETDPEQEND